MELANSWQIFTCLIRPLAVKQEVGENYLSSNLCGNHQVQFTSWDYDFQTPKGEQPAITELWTFSNKLF